MTREEARKLRDDNIQFCREGILERPSDEIFEINDVLDVIDDIIIEIEKCDKAIEALQERPKGRWEQFMIFEHIKKCSECGCAVNGKPNFCPKCGADMRESEQE